MFPVDKDNEWCTNHGDIVSCPELEKTLKVEEETTSSDFVVPSSNSSCSLHNLARSRIPGLSQMATLKPNEPGGSGGAAGGKEDRSRSMEFLLQDSAKNAHLRVRYIQDFLDLELHPR